MYQNRTTILATFCPNSWHFVPFSIELNWGNYEKEECFKFNFHKFISRASEFDRLINTDMKEAVNLVVYEFIIDVLLQEIDIVNTTEVLNGSKKVYWFY